MPKRNDIQRILLIGSGPIVIGQACEFDYSGTQACKALKEEGYTVILVNSNPATIMTDPTLADVTYIEPLTPEVLTRIIEKERPDAILPTLGGQTALNLALELHSSGVLEKFGVEMIGATPEAIEKAENRRAFKVAMDHIGLDSARSAVAFSLEEAKKHALTLGFPCVVRPSFTLGGTGGGIAFNMEELEGIVGSGLRSSFISEVLIEESLLGWKEYELEVMRDKKDNVVIICSIENLDPMGVHTGDSITVAPAQTLSDVEYQVLRNASIAILREIGVETGGSNVQFAVNPKDGRVIVIEMNPRVSRSSALASKATGFPIAKFAAKLSIGYTLDELMNDITKKTPACFETAIDYCVVKIPRFNFEKFPQTEPILGTAMKSVGEAMAIGRTFKESFQKALRSLESKRFGFGFDGKDQTIPDEMLIPKLITPNPDRVFFIQTAMRQGMSVQQLHDYTKIDVWFLYQMQQLVDFAHHFAPTPALIQKAKEWGFSDIQLAYLSGKTEAEMRATREAAGIRPTYKLVDTCAAEFESYTPYFYSTYEDEDESRITNRQKVMILGGGPNRIGQGIEFDYCCVHASFCAREEGYESIMVNSNPETVSTDFDISDKLYFEPLTFEDVLNIYEREQPLGVIVQFGGQTPLNLCVALEKAGVKVLGTSSKSIDIAEDREKFQAVIEKTQLRQPHNGTVSEPGKAIAMAATIGYPVLVRPSYVLGGASMEIVYDDAELNTYLARQQVEISAAKPLLLDKYLEDAVEVDVDALSDGTHVVVAGIMEHIEEAGVHSGDSACALPPYSLSERIVQEIKEATTKLAIELQVVGLLNIQFAVKNDQVYVLEVNPRASRTVPFVSKATGIQLAKVAARCMAGQSLASQGITQEVTPPYFSVKEAVFPFVKFPGVDTILGPEMKSTGEVMGVGKTFGEAFVKSQLGAGTKLPRPTKADGTPPGKVFISVKNNDKARAIEVARQLVAQGFALVATKGTASAINEASVPCAIVNKVTEGRPHIVDMIKNNEIVLVINTVEERRNAIADSRHIRT